MNLFQQKSRLVSILTLGGFLVFAVPVTIAAGTAIWLTGVAAYENIRFVRGTGQILSLIGVARATAAANNDFGQRPGEDLTDDLARRASLPSPPLNGWKGGIRAQIQPMPFMRIETDLPINVCRRMAIFFGKDAGSLRLQQIEAHSENSDWQAIYNAAGVVQEPDYQAMGAACGEGNTATLALTFQLR